MAGQWVARTTLLDGTVGPNAKASIATVGSRKRAEAPTVIFAVRVAGATKLRILGKTKCVASGLAEISEAMICDGRKVAGFIWKAPFVEKTVLV